MRFARRCLFALTLLLVPAALASAQVMDQVPSSALMVVHIKSLHDLSKKIAGYAAQFGPDAAASPASDVESFLTGQLKATKGLDTTSDSAIVYLDQAALGNNANANGAAPAPLPPNIQPALLLVAVSDYSALLSNYSDAQTQGAITTITLNGQTMYVAKWGNYAVYTNDQDALSATPGGLKLSDTATGQIASSDISMVLNMPQIRVKLLPVFTLAETMSTERVSRAMRNSPYSKYADAIGVVAKQFVIFAQEWINSCDDVILAANLGDAGIHGTALAVMKPDSDLGGIVSEAKDTNTSLLTGLPDGSYIFYGGAVSDPKGATQIFSQLLDPALPELDKLGDDGKTIEDYIQAIKDVAGAQTGATFGFVAPQGEPGTAPLIQFVGTRTGDAKVLAAATEKVLSINAAKFTQPPMQATYTAAAKTVGGVTFDQYHTGFDIAAAQQNPGMAMVGQYLAFVYGQDGLNTYVGPVNDTTLLGMGGISDDMMAAAVTAAKNGDDPLSKNAGMQATAALLPTQRVAATYLSLDTLANTILNYAGKFGFAVGVTMPASDPLGATMSTTGSTVQLDGYVPIKTIANMSDTVQKVIASFKGGAASNPNGGPPAQPANPGGL